MRFRKITFILATCSLLACGNSHQNRHASETLSVPAQEKVFSAFLDSLNKAGATDYQKATEIRKYLAKKIDIGQSRDSLFVSYYKIPWETLSAFHCMELFEQNKLTANCGLTSHLLAKLYDYAGFKNYTYSCGYDTFRRSHEFNLVQVGDQLLVQDAFMNMSLANADGSPKDLLPIIREIRNQDFSNIKVLEESALTEFWADSLKREELEMYCVNESYRVSLSDILVADNRIKIALNRSYSFLAGGMMRDLRQNFKADGLSENFLSLYLKPLYLKDGNTGGRADSLFAVIKKATGSGWPD